MKFCLFKQDRHKSESYILTTGPGVRRPRATEATEQPLLSSSLSQSPKSTATRLQTRQGAPKSCPERRRPSSAPPGQPLSPPLSSVIGDPEWLFQSNVSPGAPSGSCIVKKARAPAPGLRFGTGSSSAAKFLAAIKQVPRLAEAVPCRGHEGRLQAESCKNPRELPLLLLPAAAPDTAALKPVRRSPRSPSVTVLSIAGRWHNFLTFRERNPRWEQ